MREDILKTFLACFLLSVVSTVIICLMPNTRACHLTEEDYDSALRQCSQYKNLNDRNVCRMRATDKYRGLEDDTWK